MNLSLNDLEMALEFVSGDPGFGAEAYIDMVSGQIYYVGDGVDEFVPDDIGNPEKYIAVPTKRDLGLGRDTVLSFATEKLPEDYDRISAYFRHRGAFSKFRSRMEQIGALDKWYAYEQAAIKQSLKDWCDENSVEYIE